MGVKHLILGFRVQLTSAEFTPGALSACPSEHYGALAWNLHLHVPLVLRNLRIPKGPFIHIVDTWAPKLLYRNPFFKAQAYTR